MSAQRRTSIAVLGILMSGVALTGCSFLNAGPETTEMREISDVHALELDSPGDVVVTLGDAPSLSVTAGEKVIDRLRADSSDGVLRLSVDGGKLQTSGTIRYELTVTSFDAVTISGSGDAKVDFTGADDVTIAVDGSGSVDARGIDAQALSLTIHGSGDVVTSGIAREQDIEIHGSGDYKANELETGDVSIMISGSGGAEVFATETLSVRIDGSGDVLYSGDPAVTKDIAGSGGVNAR